VTRLFNPQPGEMVDRQTILTLKIEHVQGQKDFDNDEKAVKGGVVARTVVSNPTKINVHPFVDELELIRKHLSENWIPGISIDDGKVIAYDQFYDDLYDVNAQLWDLEDKARVLRDAPDKIVIEESELFKIGYETLGKINTLNDKRAELVKKINELWNIQSQEKLY
jgi:hypothetical protein